MSMLISSLICYVLGFNSRRENLIENKVFITRYISLPIYSRGLGPAFSEILCLVNVCSTFRLRYAVREPHIRMQKYRAELIPRVMNVKTHLPRPFYRAPAPNNPYNPNSYSDLRSNRPNSVLKCSTGSHPSDPAWVRSLPGVK